MFVMPEYDFMTHTNMAHDKAAILAGLYHPGLVQLWMNYYYWMILNVYHMNGQRQWFTPDCGQMIGTTVNRSAVRFKKIIVGSSWYCQKIERSRKVVWQVWESFPGMYQTNKYALLVTWSTAPPRRQSWLGIWLSLAFPNNRWEVLTQMTLSVC